MCGRYYIDPDAPEMAVMMAALNRAPLTARLAEATGRTLSAGEIVPTALAPALAMGRQGRPDWFCMQWGFHLPQSGRQRLLINARTETAAQLPTFREAWVAHRCALPFTHYYEWSHPVGPDGKKHTGDKFAIRPAEAASAWLAGLYRIEAGIPVFVVLTRAPSAELATLHDRMPLILPEEAARAWVQPQSNPAELCAAALTNMRLQQAT